MDFLSRSTVLCCCQPSQTEDIRILFKNKHQINVSVLSVLLLNAGGDAVDSGVCCGGDDVMVACIRGLSTDLGSNIAAILIPCTVYP